MSELRRLGHAQTDGAQLFLLGEYLARRAGHKVTGYELEPNYGSMFDGTNKNCKESIFELQFTNSTVDGTYHLSLIHIWE